MNTTSFMDIYSRFLTKVTDDLYLEMSEHETYECLQDLLVNAIPRFEFPRFDVFDYELGYLDDTQEYQGVFSNGEIIKAMYWIGGCFNSLLTEEEKNILSSLMVIEWLGQQLETTENSKMKFSGADFKLTSQANHMAKLKVLVDARMQDCNHMQRLYRRRIKSDSGEIRSTMGDIVLDPSYGVHGNYNGVTAFWSSEGGN